MRLAPLARLRRISQATAATALLAAALAGNFASHQHSIFSAGEDLSSHAEERFVTRHDPLSRASHWHAVIAVVHEHDCIACHNQRLVGFLVQRQDPTPVASARIATSLRPAGTAATVLLPTGSRAPPSLL